VRKMRENFARQRELLERVLADGIEARSFARVSRPLLSVTDEQIATVRGLVEQLSPMPDAASATLAAEVRLLEQVAQPFRDLLAEALSRASEVPRQIDWKRLKQESDADFAAGRFVTFEAPEDVRKGLARDD